MESLEEHRAFVREVNDSLASYYGFGGALVLLGAGVLLGVAWIQGILANLATWMVCITIVLVELYVLRVVVNRKKRSLVVRVNEYCRANNIDVETFTVYYQSTDMFPFFSDLFPSS